MFLVPEKILYDLGLTRCVLPLAACWTSSATKPKDMKFPEMTSEILLEMKEVRLDSS